MGRMLLGVDRWGGFRDHPRSADYPDGRIHPRKRQSRDRHDDRSVFLVTIAPSKIGVNPAPRWPRLGDTSDEDDDIGEFAGPSVPLRLIE